MEPGKQISTTEVPASSRVDSVVQPSHTTSASNIPKHNHPQYGTHQHSLHPALSRLSALSPQRTVSRQDGFDNFPAPLPHNHELLERQLTSNPDIQLQMADDEIGPPPEGGKEAWLCVAGAFCVLFCIFGFATTFGQLEVYYLAHQLEGYSKADVAWISSVQTTTIFALSIFSGRYFDSHGASKLLIVGTAFFLAALLGIAFSHNYWQIMLSHLSLGLSGALLYSPATAVSGHWFMRKRSTAVGVVVCGSGLAGVIYPIMLKRLIDELNFRDAMLIIMAMSGSLMIFACFTMKARLPPRRPPPLKSLLGPWSESRYSCLVIGSTLIMMNWLSPYFNAPVLASGNNASETIQSYAVALLQTGSFIGRVISGVLADRFGVWNMFVTSGIVSAVSLFAFWTPVPAPGAVVVIGLLGYGIGSGAWISLVAASCGAISPMREYGMRLGMLWSLGSLGIIPGPVVCGLLVNQKNGTFTTAAIFCGFTTLVGIIITVFPVIVRRTLGLVRPQPKGVTEAKA